MITGFNTNVRHRGRTFHVQTEDSGRAHPHVISHVYFGGTILASEKREYAELLDEPDLEVHVRALMEGQHQALVARLRQGQLDARIDGRLPADDDDGSTAAQAKASSGVDTAPSFGDSAPEPQPAAEARGFGAGVVSEKPLDEVILEYLVDKARKRPARDGGRDPAASRSKG